MTLLVVPDNSTDMTVQDNNAKRRDMKQHKQLPSPAVIVEIFSHRYRNSYIILIRCYIKIVQMKHPFMLKAIICSFCFLYITTVSAQAKFGFRAGVNITNQEFKQGDLHIKPNSKFGLDLAFIADFPLGTVVSFAPELHWLQKGFEVKDLEVEVNGQPYLVDLTSTLNYLELPLLVKFNFGETNKFFVMAGPSIGYMFSDNTKDGAGNNIEFEDILKLTGSTDEDISRVELGAHLGAGVGLGPVIIDIRYILGISNLAKDFPDAEVHNTGFGGGVSWMF